MAGVVKRERLIQNNLEPSHREARRISGSTGSAVRAAADYETDSIQIPGSGSAGSRSTSVKASTDRLR